MTEALTRTETNFGWPRRKFDGLRALSLFGKKDSVVEWELNEYSDSSGGGERVVPCTSLDEAKSHAEQIIADRIADKGVTDDLIKSRNKYGLTRPSALEEAEFIRVKIEVAKKTVSGKEEDVDKAKQKLAELESQLSAATTG